MKIKNLFLFFVLIGLIGVFAGSSFAQRTSVFGQKCDRSRLTPIKCGYFEEGYQDGLNDSQNNRSNDYKRYRRKYESQYRSYYRDGYQRGFQGSGLNASWNDAQKNTYDQGFDDGKNDRRRRLSRLASRYQGGYNRSYEAYYKKGYSDGYDNKRKQYNTNLGNRQNPLGSRFPRRNTNRRGTTRGSLDWNGRVDNRVNIILRGNTVRTNMIAGNNVGRANHRLTGSLPRRTAFVSVSKLDGRGTVRVVQQPSRANNYTAIVQVFDRKRSSDNYRLRINWRATSSQEDYSSGKLVWRGRVDQTANITIDGEDVSSRALSGRSLTQVSKNLEGYLAHRSGTIRVRKLDGRGTVRILEQPNKSNGYVAVIQIFDPKRSDDQYEIEVTW